MFERRYLELETQLASPDLDLADLAKLGKEFSSLGHLVGLSDQRLSYVASIKDLKAVEDEERKKKTPDGDEMVQLAEAERKDIEVQLVNIEDNIIKVLTPADEADSHGVVLEVRAGTGLEL